MINWEVVIWTCITLAVLMSVIGLILYGIFPLKKKKNFFLPAGNMVLI